ncbi:hypothetical protein M3Y97_00566500 [Aphelenchoides bicaudatus]|nr:hypothetical protein M3Y97_00566500 [Aphelenchoides bicaudatus]
MRQFLFLLLIGFGELSNAHINIANDFNKVVGYAGPACVVVDDLFYLHGHFIRRISGEEILAFKKYQNTLSLLRQLREAVSKGYVSMSSISSFLMLKFFSATLLNNGSISLPTPVIPDFCNGFDDTAEVVLDGCVIRGNHVYIADRVIRPINLIEKQRINAILSSFVQSTRKRRAAEETPSTSTTEVPKEATQSTTTEKPTTIQSSTTEFPISKELKEFISNTFNVNANVTERFLPVAQMSPLFSHFMRQGEQLFDPRNDDPRAYYSSNSPNVALFDTLKAQKNARSAMPANLNSATEIPHLYVDDRGMNAANQVAGGQLNPFDPLLLQLLQSLANRQQNVNEIIRQQKMIQQQLQQSQIPVNQNQQQPFVLPQNSAQSIKAGETMLIGGQPYMAVQLNSEPNGVPSIGLVPAASSTHTVTALPPIINNWMSNGAPQNSHYGPNAGFPFNGYGVPHEAIRYHPGKRPNVPMFVNGLPLPHEICRAHMVDPFVWSRT